jgi:DNA-binding cell septation regulator SpoVG
MQIKILEIRLINDGRTIKAFCDIQVNDWIVRDIRVMQEGKLYVMLPQTSWKDPVTKQIRFKSVFTIPPEQKQGIDIVVLNAYQVEREKKNGSSNK